MSEHEKLQTKDHSNRPLVPGKWNDINEHINKYIEIHYEYQRQISSFSSKFEINRISSNGFYWKFKKYFPVFFAYIASEIWCYVEDIESGKHRKVYILFESYSESRAAEKAAKHNFLPIFKQELPTKHKSRYYDWLLFATSDLLVKYLNDNYKLYNWKWVKLNETYSILRVKSQ